jgi:hypothetical protein
MLHEYTCLAASVIAAFVASLVALVEGSMTWWGDIRSESDGGKAMRFKL